MEISSLWKDNQRKIPVCGRVLQWNFPLSLEKSILEHVLTLFRNKKHFPFQEDFGPCTSRLWSGIQHWSFNSAAARRKEGMDGGRLEEDSLKARGRQEGGMRRKV
jgi:hypothetical protein